MLVMDSKLLTKVINYHGQELMRVLHEEQRPESLSVVDLRNVNYLEYHGRASEFGFQHRIRRQKLYQFIARKADKLFKPLAPVEIPVTSENENKELYAIMPPLESFMEIPSQERKWSFYQNLQKGDIVIGKIFLKDFNGCHLHLLCFDGGKKRKIHDLGIKAFCPRKYMFVKQTETSTESYQVGDILRGVVIGYSIGTQKIMVSAVPAYHLNYLEMGLLSDENLPLHYRQAILDNVQSYSEELEHTVSFNNPTCSSNLCLSLGLSCLEHLSITEGLHNVTYPKEEYSTGLRKIQSSKWAYKSVRDGVSHFKVGNYTEAFQSLNKALQIDPDNVEALVARGALFANKSNLQRAVEDFEMALVINSNHCNARKYLGETLMALGKDYEEKDEFETAVKTYKRALDFDMNNFDARNALLSLEEKRRKINEIQINSVATSTVNQNSTDRECSQELLSAREKLKLLLKQEIKASSPEVEETMNDGNSKSIEDSEFPSLKHDKQMLPGSEVFSTERKGSFKEAKAKSKQNEMSKGKSPKVFFVWRKEQDMKLSKTCAHASTMERGFKKEIKDKTVSFFFSGDSDSNDEDSEVTHKNKGEIHDKTSASSEFNPYCTYQNDHDFVRSLSGSEMKFKEFNHNRQLHKSDLVQHELNMIKSGNKEGENLEISRKCDRQIKHFPLASTLTSKDSQDNRHKRQILKDSDYHHSKLSRIDNSASSHYSKKQLLYKPPNPFHTPNTSTGYNKRFELDRKDTEETFKKSHHSQKDSVSEYSALSGPSRMTEYDAAVAAAKKISEQLLRDEQVDSKLGSTNPFCKPLKNDSVKNTTSHSNDALKQMESFLQKLRDTKKAKSLASDKH